MSCSRSPSYLERTLESIPSDFDIEIFYQGDSAELSHLNVKVIEVSSPYAKDDVQRNAQFNYATILLNSKECLIIEDDVFFSSNFKHHIDLLKNQINFLNTKYAIALYSCYTWTLVNEDEVKLCEYPMESFYGTQAMLYDIEMARNFGEHLMNNIGLEAYDMALKTFINISNNQVKLFASTRSLVQHIGEKTSGLGHFHQTSNYIG
jgi:hypothetical protein